MRITLLLFFMLISWTHTTTVVICQSEEDYYQLLYRVCLNSPVCKTLFHLTPPVLLPSSSLEQTQYITYQTEQDFALFRHQLRQHTILPLTTQARNESILRVMVPSTWIPDIAVSIDESAVTSCGFDTNALINLAPGVALTTLFALHTYKTSVSDEFFCHNPNERLIIDEEVGPYCLCKAGKVCDTESNFNHLYMILQVILIVLISLLILTTMGSLVYKRYLLTHYKLSE